jgi:DNA-binding transcriptional LysR family regulator
MQWDDVRVLLAMFRARNLHDAGVRLGLDGSTVSRRLAALEARTGGPLFARTRDGLRPTALAERLRPFAERMEADAAALIHAMRADDAAPAGIVRVATTEAFARLLAGEGLLAVCADHPGLAIEMIAGNQPVDLARGEADLAIRLAALRQPSLRVRCLATMEIGLFAAPAYLRARGAVRTAHALRGHDVLVPSGELGRLPEARWLASRPGVRVVFRSNSMPALLAAAAAGVGIVPLPVGWGDSEPGLERVLALDGLGKRRIWLVSHETAGKRPEVAIVSRHIAAIFARLFAG